MTGAMHRRLARIERGRPKHTMLDKLLEDIARSGTQLGDPDRPCPPMPASGYSQMARDELDAMLERLANTPAHD